MVTFLNPHYDDFLAEPVVFRLLGRRALKKYGYLLEGILAQEGSIFCLVDDVSSSLIPYRFFVGTEMYHGLGLQSGVHYAVHDGTVEGIQKTIMALEKNPDIPASISQNAATFIAEKMRREKVFEAIFKVL